MIPPEWNIYTLLGEQYFWFPILGVQATTIVLSLINGAIYEIIVWLAFKFGLNKKISEKVATVNKSYV
jgi:hypothetical protein